MESFGIVYSLTALLCCSSTSPWFATVLPSILSDTVCSQPGLRRGLLPFGTSVVVVSSWFPVSEGSWRQKFQIISKIQNVSKIKKNNQIQTALVPIIWSWPVANSSHVIVRRPRTVIVFWSTVATFAESETTSTWPTYPWRTTFSYCKMFKAFEGMCNWWRFEGIPGALFSFMSLKQKRNSRISRTTCRDVG